jgi:hypothetical protein
MSKTIKMSDVVKRKKPDFIIKYELIEQVKLNFFPGCMLNFSYKPTTNIDETFYDIFPEFYQGETSAELVCAGSSIPQTGTADMWIVSDRNKKIHKQELSTNRECYLLNGSEIVAQCKIVWISNEDKKAFKQQTKLSLHESQAS